MSDPVRWFDALGSCACGCGKSAEGELRGPGNASYGRYRSSCAAKRLKRAQDERAREQRQADKGKP